MLVLISLLFDGTPARRRNESGHFLRLTTVLLRNENLHFAGLFLKESEVSAEN